jgi:hypothetical protein
MSWLKNLLLVLLSIGFFLALNELALGLLVRNPPIRTNVPLDDRKHHYCRGPKERAIRHDEFEATERPNAQYFEFGNGHVFLHTYNEFGFRGPFESGEKTVFVLGDSFTRGTLADDTETMPRLLDDWAPGVSFFNFGIGGYGTINEYLVYRAFHAKYPHQLVILFFYIGNDIKDNRRTARWLEEKGSKGSSADRRADASRQPRDDGMFSSIGHFFANLNIYKFYVPRLKSFFLIDTSRLDPEDWDLALGYLRKLRALVSESHAELWVVSIPERDNVVPTLGLLGRVSDHGDGGQSWTLYGTSHDRFADQVRAALAKASHDLDFRYYSSLGVLRAAQAKGVQVYGYPDAHLTEAGYNVLARSVLGKLEEAGFVTETAERPDDLTHYDPEHVACPGPAD